MFRFCWHGNLPSSVWCFLVSFNVMECLSSAVIWFSTHKDTYNLYIFTLLFYLKKERKQRYCTGMFYNFEYCACRDKIHTTVFIWFIEWSSDSYRLEIMIVRKSIKAFIEGNKLLTWKIILSSNILHTSTIHRGQST